MAEADRTRWNVRYRDFAPADLAPPSPFLISLADRLPQPGANGGRPRVLDVAGGAGANAIWLASRGLEVTLADISPAALELARRAAAAAGATLRLLEIDLEEAPFPAGPFALIVSIDFLWRPLFATFPAALAPGGLLVFSQPTRRNLERHPHPGARFLLEEGELPHLVRGLEIVLCEEGWFSGRHEARLLARKPDAG